MSNDQHGPLIEGHDVDGIREYDNPMPRWWLYIFYVTILFAVGYWIYYHMGAGGKSVAQEYVAEMEAAGASAVAKPKFEADEATLMKAFQDPAQIAAGAKIFAGRCVACHLDKGQGSVGPNLTDDHWINGGGTLVGVFKTIRDGVPAKGMIAWGPQLKNDEMLQIVAFVASLHGTNPPNPKPPQGDKVAKVSWK